ncbi:hypothetical protein [Phenylobacterium deserti]|uniref:Uncharacterized protein n=1 Tax=Phenylobacterium deserti TaxID=1914756 RepID=A0A328AGY9_9CAUL|nr:hypothetical protein [Phenylobacterium deserti]RAK52118.1 hypothetical protein DJ018_13260 [Phenylobacterium deserti]
MSLEAHLRRMKVGPAVAERVLRLNPDPQEGERLRGLHYKRADDPRFWFFMISKGQFIRERGRAAYAALPRQAIYKQGRREFVRSVYAYQPA